MNDSASKITDGAFRALVGEQAFDIVFDEGRLRIDGEAVIIEQVGHRDGFYEG